MTDAFCSWFSLGSTSSSLSESVSQDGYTIAYLDVSHPLRALVRPLIVNRYVKALKMELFKPKMIEKRSFSFVVFSILQCF